MSVITKEDRRLKRRRRVRAKVSGTATRPRISVFRSNRGALGPADRRRLRPHACRGQLVRARAQLARAKPTRTKRAGELLAERAKAAGVSEAVFDRGGYRYHGHVRAFAEAIREAGITV